jgi:hypothetical protein
MPHHPVYGLDIETGYPAGRTDASRFDAAPPESPTGDVPAVDPRHTIIVRAVVSTAAGEQTFEGDETDLLQRLDALLGRLEPGIIATWNGASFDLPYLADRAGARAVHLGLRLAADPRRRFRGETLPGHSHAYRAAWYRHRHLDVARLYRASRRPLLEVDELLRAVGVHLRGRSAAGLGPADAPGEELTHDAVHAFATNDARLIRSLVEARLPGITRHVDRITLTGTPALPEVGVASRITLSPAHPAVRAAWSTNPN